MGFNLNDYQPVEERNALFWAKYPQGRILTELMFDDGQRYVIRCEVYTDRDDTRPAATGFAEEHVSTSGVNRTSALENCETSAEGRALARLGFAPKGARPSREEMAKTQRGPQQAPVEPSAADRARDALRAYCGERGYDLGKVAIRFEAQYGEPLKSAADAARIAAFTKLLDGMPEVDLKTAVPATNGASS